MIAFTLLPMHRHPTLGYSGLDVFALLKNELKTPLHIA
jgi:hypothetical protein